MTIHLHLAKVCYLLIFITLLRGKYTCVIFCSLVLSNTAVLDFKLYYTVDPCVSLSLFSFFGADEGFCLGWSGGNKYVL